MRWFVVGAVVVALAACTSPDVGPGELLLGAATICARLDAGDAPEDVLVVYLHALGAERGEPTVEDGQLAGSLVGAAVAVYCDHHEPALPAD